MNSKLNRLALVAGLITVVVGVLCRFEPDGAGNSSTQRKAETNGGSNQSKHIPGLRFAHSEVPDILPLSPRQARLAELQESLKQLRAKPYWQHQSLEEQIALQTDEEELREVMADLGISPTDLDPGVLQDELDFLDATRRQAIEPQVLDLQREIADLENAAARGAWESDDVDRYKELTGQKLAVLRQSLSAEEWAEYVGRHSEEADALRAKPLDLYEEQFKQVVMAEHEFNRQASAASVEELENLRSRRDEALRAALTEGEHYADYIRAQDPTYAGHIGAGSELGLAKDWSNWLFDVQNRVSQEERRLLETDLPDADREAALRQLTTEARQLLQKGLGGAYDQWVQSPAALWLSRFDGDSNPPN